MHACVCCCLFGSFDGAAGSWVGMMCNMRSSKLSKTLPRLVYKSPLSLLGGRGEGRIMHHIGRLDTGLFSYVIANNMTVLQSCVLAIGSAPEYV